MSFALLRRAFILTVVLGSAMIYVSGCGKSVSGVYADDSGTLSIEFKSGGKATVTLQGSPMDGDYTVQGKTVTVKVNGDAKVLTINDDGSLAGPDITLKKK
jgi:hypothetical protein